MILATALGWRIRGKLENWKWREILYVRINRLKSTHTHIHTYTHTLTLTRNYDYSYIQAWVNRRGGDSSIIRIRWSARYHHDDATKSWRGREGDSTTRLFSYRSLLRSSYPGHGKTVLGPPHISIHSFMHTNSRIVCQHTLWVMSHIYESCRLYMRHVSYIWVILLSYAHVLMYGYIIILLFRHSNV